MAAEHDSPRRLRGKPKETPDETEARLSRELAYLMRDPRYRDGDPDYRAYIHRQFRRVYDDPAGKPQPLRLGRPKVFVDGLEPFDPARERRLRLGEGETTEGKQIDGAGNTRRTTLSKLGAANRGDSKTVARVVRRASSSDDGSAGGAPDDALQARPSRSIAHRQGVESRMQDAIGHRSSGEDVASLPDDPVLRERLIGTVKDAETLIEIGRDDGYLLTAEYLKRYLNRTGGVIQVPWSELLEFSYFQDAQVTVQDYYQNWFLNKEEDHTVGQPFLYLKDGESLTLGAAGPASNLRWDATWKPGVVSLGRKELDPRDVSVFEQDHMAAFGAAAIKGYGNITFTRRGNVIYVAGQVDMRFDERFDFEDDFGLIGWVTLLSLRAPDITASDLHELEVHGLAKPFRTQSSKLWLVSGYITLVGGEPDPSKSRFHWQELEIGDVTPDASPGGAHPVIE